MPIPANRPTPRPSRTRRKGEVSVGIAESKGYSAIPAIAYGPGLPMHGHLKARARAGRHHKGEGDGEQRLIQRTPPRKSPSLGLQQNERGGHLLPVEGRSRVPGEGLGHALAENRFAELYRDHGRFVLAYALRRAVPEDAADVVAETFLVAWRRLDDVPGDGRARLWLYGVAHRVLADHTAVRCALEAPLERAHARLQPGGPVECGAGRGSGAGEMLLVRDQGGHDRPLQVASFPPAAPCRALRRQPRALPSACRAQPNRVGRTSLTVATGDRPCRTRKVFSLPATRAIGRRTTGFEGSGVEPAFEPGVGVVGFVPERRSHHVGPALRAEGDGGVGRERAGSGSPGSYRAARCHEGEAKE
jgi:hypothetical protein